MAPREYPPGHAIRKVRLKSARLAAPGPTLPTLVALVPLAALAACAGGPRTGTSAAPAYQPVTRALTITAVPLLTHEMEKVYPFLKQDFAKGGVLDGKEVYAFLPSSITAVEGDTLKLTIVNPEDDQHTFVMQGLTLNLPGESVTHATYIARRPGIFRFVCMMPAHLPYMYGEIVVLPARDGAAFQAAAGAAPAASRSTRPAVRTATSR